MITIEIRCATIHKECKIVDGNATINCGLLNSRECEELATLFRQAAEDLDGRKFGETLEHDK